MTDPSSSRRIERIVAAHRQIEGAGFMVRRAFPTDQLDMVDPFLLIDEMGPTDYGPGQALGAPDHPHRGFETVTYVLAGEMEHEDSAGNRGTLGPGDVQWMTAGAGIVHAEMPSARFRQRGGRLHAFQIWVNLRARDKMMPPRYQELSAGQIPVAQSADGLADVRVIAGEALGAHAVIDTHTPIVYLDWTLRPGARIEQPTRATDRTILYVFEGGVQVGPNDQFVSEGYLAILEEGQSVWLQVPAAAERAARLLLLAGAPLGEPVARSGPFVMNTRAEIDAAVRDYRAGRLIESDTTAKG